jgi:hypothetical protein
MIMSTITSPRRVPAVRSIRAERLLIVAAAAMATSLVWVVASAPLGLDLSQPGFGTQPPQALPIWWVAVITVVAGLAGWGVLAVIERVTNRPAGVWLAVSLVALVLSLGGPTSGEGVGTANRLALVAMHLAAGAVLIPSFYRSARRRIEEDR